MENHLEAVGEVLEHIWGEWLPVVRLVADGLNLGRSFPQAIAKGLLRGVWLEELRNQHLVDQVRLPERDDVR